MPSVRVNRGGLLAGGTFLLCVLGLVLTGHHPVPSFTDGGERQDGLVINQQEHQQMFNTVKFAMDTGTSSGAGTGTVCSKEMGHVPLESAGECSAAHLKLGLKGRHMLRIKVRRCRVCDNKWCA